MPCVFESKLDSKYRILVLKYFRDQEDLHKGDKVIVTVKKIDKEATS